MTGCGPHACHCVCCAAPPGGAFRLGTARRRDHGAPAQRGAALLMAMLTVTLVATFAAAAMWQQWRASEVEAAERARVQSSWVLVGALDWARLILREDARSGGADYLAEPWAVPLEEARLSTFLAADQNNTGGNADDSDDAQNAFLSGRMIDLQSRLNVANLVQNGQVSAPAQLAFERLFSVLGLAPAQLSVLTDNLLLASNGAATAATPATSAATGSTTGTPVATTSTSANNTGNALAPLLPQRVGQLVWLGLSPATLAALRPYITLLPVRTPVNLNTASAEVLYACIPGIEMADAQKLVTQRDRTHFATLADAAQLLGAAAGALNADQHGVSSRFFEVRGRLRLDQTVVQERSVVQREGLDVRVLWRERGVPPVPPGQTPPAN
ncbi:MAG: type II secretion system minor pseudopilin GspK [Rhodoferax sp.]|nr:type II secretion system minor pseudopilin GspK [Rhodoferax sp.]